MSKIEWTEQTWNPIVGCSVVSPGCTNCYAMKLAPKLAGNPKTPHYAGTAQNSKAGPVWTGKVALAPYSVLTAPLRRKKPTTYFVNSMGDLFHGNVPDDWIDQVFAIMALCPQHTFQVLTKRSARMRTYMAHVNAYGETRNEIIDRTARFFIEDADLWEIDDWPLPNIWLGVSAEDQTRADERIPDLLETPAAIRFVSAEPLLEPIDLFEWLSGAHQTKETDWIARRLNWVIAGGESGRNARPMHPDWVRSIRDQCEDAGTAFFFKQWGEWGPENWSDDCSAALWISRDGTTVDGGIADVKAANCEKPMSLIVRHGKKSAGRLLDGREWNGVPS